MNIIASAYGKDSDPAGFIQSSDLLYLDPDKGRTENRMQSFGLQLPSDATAFGSVGSVSYQNGNVKIDGVPYAQYMQTSEDANAELSAEGEPEWISLPTLEDVPDKNRAEARMMQLRVQFPSRQPALDSVGSVPYQDGNVKDVDSKFSVDDWQEQEYNALVRRGDVGLGE